MSITFSYKQIKRPGLLPSFCPAIPITLAGKESVDTYGLLDSGADFSAIPKGIAEILGIELSGKHEKIRGVGGETEAVTAKITVVVEKGHERYSIPVDFKVLLQIESDFPILLGRKGFFGSFRITFDEKNQKITLKRTDIRSLT